MLHRLLLCLLILTSHFSVAQDAASLARQNGQLVNEGFNRCIRFVNAWMKHADSATGLIPRNLRESKDFWNAWDAAADNYPFMVMTASILMPEFFNGRALEMLKTERRLTARIGTLPDTYSFSKKGFRNELIDTNQILFGAAEYMKDGLVPLTEWLGKSPWSNRMLEMLDDLPRILNIEQPITGDWFGNSATVEVHGDLMQVLTRMYWFTKNPVYLERAIQLADHYLQHNRLPTEASNRLRIRDHGCEIISGLCEVYLACSFARPEKRMQWKPQIHRMLDRILEVGRNADGLFYDEINPQTGAVIAPRIADNFGYTLNAYYSIAQIDSVPAYREAVIKALSTLNQHYRNVNWENGSADGYADALEGALNLYNREPIASVAEWLDSQIHILWDMQQSDGMIEGWHGDGNFARTTLMYCLWKTQGVLPDRWQSDLLLGAVKQNNGILLHIFAASGWKGRLRFHTPRYRDQMGLPVDYPRINQFQEWFTVGRKNKYRITINDSITRFVSGKKLIRGIGFNTDAHATLKIEQVKQKR